MVKSQSLPRRNIISIEVKLGDSVLREIVDDVNDAIGQVNSSVADRNIPYIRIEETKEYRDLDKARVLLRSETTDSRVLSEIENEFDESAGNTFLVELYINDNGYIEIGCADDDNLQTMSLSNLVRNPGDLVDVVSDAADLRQHVVVIDGQPLADLLLHDECTEVLTLFESRSMKVVVQLLVFFRAQVEHHGDGTFPHFTPPTAVALGSRVSLASAFVLTKAMLARPCAARGDAVFSRFNAPRHGCGFAGEPAARRCSPCRAGCVNAMYRSAKEALISTAAFCPCASLSSPRLM